MDITSWDPYLKWTQQQINPPKNILNLKLLNIKKFII